MPNQPDELITSTEAAEVFGVEPATIRSWIRRGQLEPAVRIPGRHLFRRADVETLAAERREKPNGRRRSSGDAL